jgi:hypothetical protein
MFFKIALPTAALTVAGLIFGLIQYERTAPLADKPSIRLRALTGELPTRDLHGALDAAQAEVTASQAAQAQAIALKKQHEQAGAIELDLYRQLEQRISEKATTVWSSPVLATSN